MSWPLNQGCSLPSPSIFEQDQVRTVGSYADGRCVGEGGEVGQIEKNFVQIHDMYSRILILKKKNENDIEIEMI